MITEEDVCRVPLFASLEGEQVTRIVTRAADVRLRAGDWVAREGEVGAFFVLLDGSMEIVKLVAGRQQQLAVRQPGEYFGEVPLLLNAPFFASARALESVRLLRLTALDFSTLIGSVPALRAELSQVVLTRVSGVEEMTAAAQPLPQVIGSHIDLDCHNLRDFLARNFVEFEWLDPTNRHDLPCIPPAVVMQDCYPVLLLPNGTTLTEPSLRQVAEAVSLATTPAHDAYDVVIIGGGPSGLSAAVYGASEGLHTLMVEDTAPGGQAGTSSRIENYLGFPIGVSGDDLSSRALSQAQRFGAEIVVTRKVCAVSPDSSWHLLTLEDGVTIRTHAIVIATGVSYRTLDVPGLADFVGMGVYYGAARTEALNVRGHDVFLIGGGNSAGQAAMFFSNYARQVTLLVRGPALAASMSSYLIDQLAARSNIAVRTDSELVGAFGHSHLEEIVIRHRTQGEERVPADGVFIFIGADAQTEWLPPTIVRDQYGFIVTGRDLRDRDGAWAEERDPYLLETSVPGIFAAGDVRHGSIKRVASAVGEGSMSISLIHQYLTTQGQLLPR